MNSYKNWSCEKTLSHSMTLLPGTRNTDGFYVVLLRHSF